MPGRCGEICRVELGVGEKLAHVVEDHDHHEQAAEQVRARARSALQQSYAVATMLGDRRLTAETLNTLGGLELETRNLEAAETALLEAEALASADPTILARVEQNLGIVSNIRGDLEVAETHYRRSLAAYEAMPDPHGSAIAHHNLGMLASDRGDHAKASEHFTTCEDLAEASRDSHLVALCLLNHAEALVALGRPAKARENAEAAERMFQGLGVHFDVCDVHRVLALCDRAEGLLPQAEARLIQARELSRQTGARLTEAEVLRELGRLYAQTGRAAEGVGLLHEAAQAFAGLGAKTGLLDLDVYGPSAPTLLGVGARRPQMSADKVLDPLPAHGLKTMSIGYLVDAASPMICEQTAPLIT